MKRNIRRSTLVIGFALALAMSMAETVRAQGPECTLALTAGKWGFTTNGTIVGVGPRSSLGIFTLDAAGNLLNGKATASLNGSVTDEAFSGTYTVNPDCTGTFAFEVFDQSGNKILTATLDIVWDDNVRELRALFTSAVLPNGTSLGSVITADARRLFTEAGNDPPRGSERVPAGVK